MIEDFLGHVIKRRSSCKEDGDSWSIIVPESISGHVQGFLKDG